jgi:3',5'-cyclic AMP phosphodiesterase CpdA
MSNFRSLILVSLACSLAALVASAQEARPWATPLVAVRPIDPPRRPLPSEAASATVRRFSFIAYGDTRSQVDGEALQPEHGAVVDRMLAKARQLAATVYPVRFVLQSGDAVVRGNESAQWNVSFTPLIEKLTRTADLPFFFALGNHDVPPGPPGDTRRAEGLHNTLSAMSRLVPPEGSARRLNGYLTYAFGYGQLFAIAIDSNIAADATQLTWVTDQLEHLDRARYKHIVVFFHHPPFSAGPHGGVSPGASVTPTVDNVEVPTAAIRRLYGPLFRRHHVKMTIGGHDHLYDHWVERYVDGGETYRIDHLVTGGGGAPIYVYRGEPEVAAYLAAGAREKVRLQHLTRPGGTIAENPHHFVVVQVDGDRLSLEVVGIGPAGFRPYAGKSTTSLEDGPS